MAMSRPGFCHPQGRMVRGGITHFREVMWRVIGAKWRSTGERSCLGRENSPSRRWCCGRVEGVSVNGHMRGPCDEGTLGLTCIDEAFIACL